MNTDTNTYISFQGLVDTIIHFRLVIITTSQAEESTAPDVGRQGQKSTRSSALSLRQARSAELQKADPRDSFSRFSRQFLRSPRGSRFLQPSGRLGSASSHFAAAPPFPSPLLLQSCAPPSLPESQSNPARKQTDFGSSALPLAYAPASLFLPPPLCSVRLFLFHLILIWSVC
jgi:hypothetical protein